MFGLANFGTEGIGRIARSLRRIASIMVVLAFASGAIAHSAHASPGLGLPLQELSLSASAGADGTPSDCTTVEARHCCCVHASLPVAEASAAHISLTRDFAIGAIVRFHGTTRGIETPPPKLLT